MFIDGKFHGLQGLIAPADDCAIQCDLPPMGVFDDDQYWEMMTGFDTPGAVANDFREGSAVAADGQYRKQEMSFRIGSGLWGIGHHWDFLLVRPVIGAIRYLYQLYLILDNRLSMKYRSSLYKKDGSK